MTHHLKERIEYAKDHLAWLESGAPEGKEPWREWQRAWHDGIQWEWAGMCGEPDWRGKWECRRRPKLLHAIDAKGKRWEWPEPMREVLEPGTPYWISGLNSVSEYFWHGGAYDWDWLEAGLCHYTKEGAEAHLAALRAVCRGGE